MISPSYNLRLNWDDQWHMDCPHFHEEIEILLSLSARGDFLIGNELYQLQRGALFLLGEATLHKSIANEEYKRYVLHISPAVLHEISTPQSDFLGHIRKTEGRCTLLDDEKTAELVRMFRRMEKPADDSFGADIRKTVQLLDFLMRVISLFESKPAEARHLNPDFARITPILNYIQKNLSKPLTLDGIASHFFISKFHMSHVFKSSTGFSVMEYIIHCRVLKARELLRAGLRVQEVGEMVGFQSNAHFIRTFGKLTGTSPKRYAREHLEGDFK